MTRTQQWLLLIAAGAVAAMAGYGIGHRTQTPETSAVSNNFGFQLQDLEGRTRTLSDWRGKAVLVNFWATWCPPCRTEIPLLIAAEQQYGPRGLQIIGIAVNRPSKVRAFSARMHINYPVLLGEDQSIGLLQQAGDGQGLLPYSLMFARNGRVIATRVGTFSAQALKRDIARALETHPARQVPGAGRQ